MKERKLLTAASEEIKIARKEIRQGRFQRTKAIITAFSAIVSGYEAYSQHQRGAFKNKLMWTPVLLVPPVVAAAGAAVVNHKAARRFLPLASAASLIDGIVGFIYHIRGIRHLPGGFKLGLYNVVIGPPIFAPLLMSIVGVLGGIASYLRPEKLSDFESGKRRIRRKTRLAADKTPSPILIKKILRINNSRKARAEEKLAETEIAHGRFQQGMALTSASLAILAGGEAFAEHMRGSYNQRIMWTPVWVTPPMVAAAIGAARSQKVAHHVLPVVSLVTMLDGLLGFGLHLRGLKNMPGSFRNMAFNVTYGPPLFAPLLFSAVGLLGLVASLLRRSK